MAFGAVGDGSKDDSLAFIKAWKAACKSSSNGKMVVTSGKKFLVNPTTFSGPCQWPVSVHIQGTIIAPAKKSAWKMADTSKWLEFSGISGLSIGGGGIINGQGQIWWQKSCKVDKKNPCRKAPTAIHISSCRNVVVTNLQFVNSQQIHLGIFYSSALHVSGLMIKAPKDSPNTDGIHLQGVTNAKVYNCDIGTGDDCISITSGTSNFDIQNIRCGPGHGISIGSLGYGGEKASVENIRVKNVVFDGTETGARIKTWQGGSGYARQITFSDIKVNDVAYPIIIDQNYCDSSKICKMKKSAVQIQNVSFQNFRGTSTEEQAVKFVCSKSMPCREIVVRDIDIKSVVSSATESVCVNAYGLAFGHVYPPSCLRRM
ncbi:probable polygalacturonase At1g80170 [Cryptomeria japonica]|uniref:probable polygalacturonase At1g80170 n=1 Tax=Cryptomeria japonica TaxID=3369 RepID=UPI0027DA3DBC|nr:probable polygalacturonase At1g80170 [Cryptomeria japonica]